MWWNSNIIKFIVIPFAGLVIIPLIWAIVRKIVKWKEESFANVIFMLIIYVVPVSLFPITFIIEHKASPVTSACRELPDGRFEVQDSTRYCYEVVDSTQIFTAIIEQKARLSLFDTCTICRKTLFDHETEQHTDAQIYANRILPSAPWE